MPTPVVAGTFWIALHLTVVLGPLLALPPGETPPPGTFSHELAVTLGFAGAAMMAEPPS